jgi:hypothetical protein
MNKFGFPLSLCAMALLAACASTDPVTPAPAAVVVAPAPVVTAPPPTVVVQQPQAGAPVVLAQPTAIRAGNGRVESISALPPSAAAGGRTLRRIGIKMDDGTVQYVDTAASLSMGERVELTSDGQVKH